MRLLLMALGFLGLGLGGGPKVHAQCSNWDSATSAWKTSPVMVSSVSCPCPGQADIAYMLTDLSGGACPQNTFGSCLATSCIGDGNSPPKCSFICPNYGSPGFDNLPAQYRTECCAGGAGVTPPAVLNLSFSPNEHNFGEIEVDKTANLSITVTNSTGGDLTGCGFSLESTNPAHFALGLGTCGTPLANTASCQLSLTAKPQSEGAFRTKIKATCGAVTGTSGDYRVTAKKSATPPSAGCPFDCSIFDASFRTTNNIATMTACPSTVPANEIFDPDGSNHCTCTKKYGDYICESNSCSSSCEWEWRSECTTNPSGPCSTSLKFNPNTYNFGEVEVGKTSSLQTITVTNSSGNDLASCGFTLEPAASAHFALSSVNCGTPLANTASCQLSLTAKPQSTGGPHLAKIKATCGVAGDPTKTVTATSGDYQVTGKSPPPPPVGVISFNPNTYDFGSVEVGKTSSLPSITVTNSTGNDLASCGFTLEPAASAHFALSSVNCGTTLANTASCQLSLTAAPQSTGAVSTKIKATCGAVTNTSGDYQLNGIPPTSGAPVPACSIEASCNREASSCACRSGYIAVDRPSNIQVNVPCGIQIAGLKNQVREAAGKRDLRLLALLIPILDQICPSAAAQTVNCDSGKHCEQEIYNHCESSVSACSKEIQYSDGGAAPPTGCTVIPTPCKIKIDCMAWQTSNNVSTRSCTVTDSCFGGVNKCAPFNHFSYKTNSFTQRVSGNPGDSGTKVCIPDCENSVGSAPSGLRYVWTGANAGKCACAVGYVYNPLTRKCTSPLTVSSCDRGSGGRLPSVVSPSVTGEGFAEAFDNAVNKKLNCCLNGNMSNAIMSKFDCVDNTLTPYTDFDAAWASRDPDANGGQINALFLSDGAGRPLTGFYSVDGRRATQFTEFTNDPIPRGRINPRINNQQLRRASGSGSNNDLETLGAAVAKPSGAAWDAMVAGMSLRLGGAAVAPTRWQDRLDYPILVRAVGIYDCPRNSVSMDMPLRTLQTLAGGVVTQEICPVAGTVMVHIRIEQIWEIMGQKTMKTIDTVLDSTQLTGISVDELIQAKYGPGCPPGKLPQGDACVDPD